MQKIAFVKKPHKVSLLPKDGEALLGNRAVSGLILPATICKSCEKVLLDYSQAQMSKNPEDPLAAKQGVLYTVVK